MNRLWPHLKDKKLVIFDYNGTILYDTEICVETLNLLLQDQGLNPITIEKYRQTFYFPVKSFYNDMGFDDNKITFTELSRQFYDNYNKNLHRCSVYDGLKELILQLKQNQIKTSILTALNQMELYKQMPIFGLEGLFDAAFGLGDFHAQSKVQRGQELMQHMQIDPLDCILIGDTTHDAEVAHALGIDVILLDDGHQTTDRLHKHMTINGQHIHRAQNTVFTLNRNFKKL